MAADRSAMRLVALAFALLCRLTESFKPLCERACTTNFCMRRGCRATMISQEDAESNARLMAALFGGVDDAAEAIEKSTDVPSHMQLDYGEDGQPLQLRFVYVDEVSCIGCTFCADVARNTFYMNEDAGRARLCREDRARYPCSPVSLV